MFLEIANDCALKRRRGASAAVLALANTGARNVEFVRLFRQECDCRDPSPRPSPADLLLRSQIGNPTAGAQGVRAGPPQSP
jgi:hypothetical protein